MQAPREARRLGGRLIVQGERKADRNRDPSMPEFQSSFRVVARARRVLDAPKAIVAIPVKNAEPHLLACLTALAAQRETSDFATILLLHNCVDRTEQVAIAAADTLPLALRILSIDLPADRGGTGWARRHLMDAAASLIVTSGVNDGLILTTEADARVAPDWVAATLAAHADGADAVAGKVDLVASATDTPPGPLRRRYDYAERYARLITDIDSHLDPDPLNPPPLHRQACAASLAVTVEGYLRAGGIPTTARGADRGLLTALNRAGLRVRHDPKVRATAPWALEAGAAGVAAQFRAWSEGQTGFDTLGLEPVAQIVRRARLRRTMRKVHASGQLWNVNTWSGPLRVATIDAFKVAALPQFQEVWAALEAISPLLAPHPLSPAQLLIETARALALVGEMRLRAGLARLTSGRT